MKTFVSLRSIVQGLALMALVGVCHTAEVVAPILVDDLLTASQVSLVGIQAKDDTLAEVIVKALDLMLLAGILRLMEPNPNGLI